MAYLGNTPLTQSFISGTDVFLVGATAQTVFTLSRQVASVNDIIVQVGTNAALPASISYYTVSGNTLTLITSVTNNTVYVRYVSTITQQLVPGIGSVGIAQLSASGVANNSSFLRGDNTWAVINAGTLSGVLAITSGGTGQTSQQAAISALVGSVANATFLRGNGTNAVMASISASDLPASITSNTTGTAGNVTGVVAVANGGTNLGTTPANGQLLIGNGANYVLNTLTAGSAISIANAAGSITINNTGVSSFSGGSTGLSSSQATGAITLTGTLGIANGGTGATNATTAISNLGLGTGNNVVFNQVSDAKGELRTIPQNVQTSAYTLTASDSGKHVMITTGGVTVPSGTFSGGQLITIWNNSGSAQTITQGSGVTMYNAGDGTTGNRTLAGRGLATVFCMDSGTFVISGAGLS